MIIHPASPSKIANTQSPGICPSDGEIRRAQKPGLFITLPDQLRVFDPKSMLFQKSESWEQLGSEAASSPQLYIFPNTTA